MSVEIPAEYSPFITAVVARGEYRDESDVVAAALQLLKRRDEALAEIRAGFDQLDQGLKVDGEVVFQKLRDKAAAMTKKS
jgi:putative addiction module CopG family antidote